MSDDQGSDDPKSEEESHATPEGDASGKQDTSGDANGAAHRIKSRLLRNQNAAIRNKMPLHPVMKELETQ